MLLAGAMAPALSLWCYVYVLLLDFFAPLMVHTAPPRSPAAPSKNRRQSHFCSTNRGFGPATLSVRVRPCQGRIGTEVPPELFLAVVSGLVLSLLLALPMSLLQLLKPETLRGQKSSETEPKRAVGTRCQRWVTHTRPETHTFVNTCVCACAALQASRRFLPWPRPSRCSSR